MVASIEEVDALRRVRRRTQGARIKRVDDVPDAVDGCSILMEQERKG
jgi:hypothetical protein